jgi:hypothetical protein
VLIFQKVKTRIFMKRMSIITIYTHTQHVSFTTTSLQPPPEHRTSDRGASPSPNELRTTLRTLPEHPKEIDCTVAQTHHSAPLNHVQLFWTPPVEFGVDRTTPTVAPCVVPCLGKPLHRQKINIFSSNFCDDLSRPAP